jgi:hypothetical protein
MICAVGSRIELDDARRLRSRATLEQLQRDSGGLPREHAEIDAAGEDGGA